MRISFHSHRVRGTQDSQRTKSNRRMNMQNVLATMVSFIGKKSGIHWFSYLYRKHVPGTVSTNRAPWPGIPVSLSVMPVIPRISDAKNNPSPVPFPYPREKIISFSFSGIPAPLSSQATKIVVPKVLQLIRSVVMPGPPCLREFSRRFSKTFGSMGSA